MTDRFKNGTGQERHSATVLQMPSDQAFLNKSYDYYAFHNDQSPKLKQDQFSIYGIDLSQLEDGSIEATALIRSTVHKPIRLKTSPVVLLKEDGQPAARISVDFSSLGAIKPNTAHPWQFVFSAETLLGQGIPDLNKWSLAFETKPSHKLDMTDEEKAAISEVSLAKLRKIVDQAPQLDSNELSFMGLSIKRTAAEELITTLLIRNGTMQDLHLKQVPLVVYDATGDIAAKGTFRLSHLTIKANTSKPVTLTFPGSSIEKEGMDLSSWKVEHVGW